MCGICGVASRAPEQIRITLTAMMQRLQHRGPDDQGYWITETTQGGTIGLATTRLAILDLSAAGHQPMLTTDARLAITFNGEVYNFRQLRAELESYGYCFRTNTDTEVVLYAYRHWGSRFVERLRGMFALAIWDANEQQLLLARDRMGIKPFYYWCDGTRFVFASEVRALMASSLVPGRLSVRGLNGYLALGALQDPDTLVEGVQSLPAGHYATWRQGSLMIEPYWQPHLSLAAARTSCAEAVERVRALLVESVQLHSIADVPVGVFLSGGLDSTALVGLMTQLGGRVHTISVVFPESPLSEAVSSRLVAQYYGTEHAELPLTGADMLAALPKAFAAMDQPTVDGVNTYMVSQHAHTVGLKVAMSGLGADEVFGGYSNFRRYPVLRAATHLGPAWLRRAFASYCTELPLSSDTQLKLKSLLGGMYGTDPFPMLRSLFSPQARIVMAPAALRTTVPMAQQLAAEAACFRGAARTSWWELNYYMKNMLLRDTDSLSMDRSLEIRVPFLDHRLIEYVLTLPTRIVQPRSARTAKPLLSAAVADLLPAAIRRRSKTSFVLPLSDWMRSELRPEIETTLFATPCPALDSVLNADSVAAIWRRYLDGSGTWHRPWALFVLKRWIIDHVGTA